MENHCDMKDVDSRREQVVNTDLVSPTSDDRYNRSRARGCMIRGQSTRVGGKARSAVCNARDNGDTTSSSGGGLSPFALRLALRACSTPTSVRLVSNLHMDKPFQRLAGFRDCCKLNSTALRDLNLHERVYKAGTPIRALGQKNVHNSLPMALEM